MQLHLKEINPNPANPRAIRDEQFKSLKRSLAQFPQMLDKRGIAVIKDGGKWVAIGGNQRYRALCDLKKEIDDAGFANRYDATPQAVEVLTAYFAKGVPCVDCSDLDEYQQRRFVIADNLPFGEWDFEALANEWNVDDLHEWGLDVPGWGEGGGAGGGDVEEDDFEAPDAETVQTDIVRGDLFEIGPHRLLCGDSTNADDVALLLDGDTPRLMVTDPPYGVEYDANWRNEALRSDGTPIAGRAIGKVANDDRADWREAWALTPAKVAYVWHADKFANVVLEGLQSIGFVMRRQIIWAKSHFSIGRGVYHLKHEPCFYAVREGESAEWIGDRTQTTLWEIPKPQRNETGHSTQKPVECMATPIQNHAGDVHDPFLGSGTTMVACEQLGRACYGMEFEPKYCQIIVDRMRKLNPDLEIKKNGQPYEPNQF